MKKVVAIIKAVKLEDVKAALVSVGVQGMTVSEVKGFGRQKGYGKMPQSTEHPAQFLPKIKLKVVVPTELVEPVIEKIIAAARTGSVGDGKIFVTSMEAVVRIRTGERDKAAL